MQLIYPGSHNFIFLFNLMIVLAVGIIGLILITQCIARIKKHGWNFIKILFLFIGGTMFSFSLLNAVNYQMIFNQKKQDNFGKYINSEKGYNIRLNQDMTWNSSHGIFTCSSGKWEYILDEDGEWINLTGQCEHYFSYQFKPTKDNRKIKIYKENGVLLEGTEQIFNK